VADLAVLLLRGDGAAGFGGLPGLESAFDRAGLGATFASWVAVGPNLSVTPEEIDRALGPSLEAMAVAGRTERARLAASLAALLPQVIDRLTPGGRLPAGRLGTLWMLGRMLLGGRQRGAA
jgi:uncharacterized protein YidB (DUF937 family)